MLPVAMRVVSGCEPGANLLVSREQGAVNSPPPLYPRTAHTGLKSAQTLRLFDQGRQHHCDPGEGANHEDCEHHQEHEW
jgi:hypothetical protein